MALNPQEFQQLQQRLGGKPSGSGASTAQPMQSQPGYLSRVGQSIKTTAQGLGSDLVKQADTIAAEPSQVKKLGGLARSGLRTAGATVRAAFTPLTEAPGVKQATEFVGEKLSGTVPMQKFQEWSQKHPEAAQDIEDVLDIAGLFGGKAVAQPLARATQSAAKKTLSTAEQAVSKVPTLIKEGGERLAPPPPSPLDAVGQVLQGETRDLKSGIKAFKEIDTTGVKSYDELYTKVDDSIKSFSKKVDTTLDSTTPVKLKDLQIKGETSGGKSVSTDYVGRGLEQLKELYTSIGDDVAAKNIDELLRRAKSVGLTRLEVNNISRMYGSEFGQKAFSPKGDALTSVNAQRFENTRSGLKEVARQGIKGKTAKVLDESISAMYRVRDLARKNLEAVNKLNQKIQERGLLEKAGYYIAKTFDTLSGGTVRGIFGGLLPRGVGYKVMNALDIEQSLKRNLEVIQKALNAKDPELMKLLKKAKKSLDKPDPVK